MSARVSIVLPDEAAAAPSTTPQKSPRSSAIKTPPASAKSEGESAAPLDSALVKVSMTDLFPDNCERYKKDCCCCHCVDVRCTLKRAAFLKTPEGKRRLEMKMHLKNFFMDLNAMTEVRRVVQHNLYGEKEMHPSSQNSYPVSITNVGRIDSKCMSLDWYIHDQENIAHYEIYVDKRLSKRIFNRKQTSTVVLDVDMKRMHNIILKAVPRAGLGSKADPMDKLVLDVYSCGMKKAIKNKYFCECDQKTDMERIEETYKKNNCLHLVDFWKDSEFIYMPMCSCPHDCDCDCFAAKLASVCP